MVYSEVKDLCETKKITIAALADHIGMTRQGLKASLDNNKLSSDKLFMLCKYLQITPNQFFRIPENATIIGNNIQQTGAVNMQQVQNGIDILQQQLAKKDEQIDKLLTLLNK